MPSSETDFRTPGQLIDHLLQKRGWSKRSLAIILAVDETIISKVIMGKRTVDAKLAIQLGEVFEVDPKVILDLQQSFELARAKIEMVPDPNRASRARLFGDTPVMDMKKRGWIQADSLKDVALVERELAKFFGAASPSSIPVAAKKTDESKPITMAQWAWIRRVQQIAGELIVPRFTADGLDSALRKLKGLMAAPEMTREVPKILLEAGVRFILVEALPAAKIDGVCFWIGSSPVVGLSLRFDRIDNFWHVLMHELGHVYYGDGKLEPVVDVEMEGSTGHLSEVERRANDFSSAACVDPKKMESFVARKAPFFAERDLLGFAKVTGVHPGIVSGRLQHITGRYDRFRTHQVKIREFVLQSSIHDGWGDVYPTE